MNNGTNIVSDSPIIVPKVEDSIKPNNSSYKIYDNT